MNEPYSYERYQRQIILEGFGEEGQEKLLRAKALVVGAGGLGCPALQYLVAAGVGTVGIVDDDVVTLHNLHRQILFTTTDIGLSKAEVAAKRLHEMNPSVQINAYPFRLTTQNALELFSSYDFVLDGTDNFATRYLINDACVLLGKPLLYGAVAQFEGQVAIFNAGDNAVNYRDLFPQPPVHGGVLNCAEAGVLGVLPGLVGTMQATETIKLITGMGKPLVNQLLTYNALTHDSFVFGLNAREETELLLPKDANDFEQRDYEWLCGTTSDAEEIDNDAFERFFHDKQTTIIDVREEGEQPLVKEFQHTKLPLTQLKENAFAFQNDILVLFCQSGKRSREAAKLLSATFGPSKKIYSLKGGILHWKKEHGTKA
ncbi:HesA/MoeB/ThiF family protein [Flavisolibacter ginsenosidimutans]|uniref:Molybdopterin-synthase adenylyltransferase n=1 Tax=Flavisolibacter ginsenosidimutans TaxID=661481 RepID=A0A5B8UQ00_9BACT|nr:HesA/MoeB/ThiF family protein [Flavisolibacter ginsenosidimutans]QEC58120.1 molybdopterin-synthase adenylyltransferase MoeB [Flavisolibacter ginsenosidimutans]